MTILFIAASLIAIFFYLCAAHQRDRADNMEIVNAQLRDKIADLNYELDDAWRHVDKLQASNSHLIREATTMGDDLVRLERERAWVAAGYQHSKAVKASSMLYAEAWQGMVVSRKVGAP